MNTTSGSALFRNFRILLDTGSSLKIIMGKLAEKIKQKIQQKLCGKPKPGSSRPQQR